MREIEKSITQRINEFTNLYTNESGLDSPLIIISFMDFENRQVFDYIYSKHSTKRHSKHKIKDIGDFCTSHN